MTPLTGDCPPAPTRHGWRRFSAPTGRSLPGVAPTRRLDIGGTRTHRTQEQTPGDDFVFVGSLGEAIEQAGAAAGDKQVHLMGGAQIICQALAAGLVDELTIITAPVLLGAGKRLFDGFSMSVELEHLGVRQSPFATFVDYAVKK